MADNIYLLETRLSKAQQAALLAIREVARGKGLTVFLVGGAVRDLIGGTAVRDLDVVVQGNALKLKRDIEKAGGVISGEMESGQRVFARFPGGVRVEIGSTVTVTYPKPGKAVVKPATILDDLRRRDFTANAMAISLNEGSYGLLMDPLNGVADIENRELRLVSNYGFIEDPVRMIRAARLMARLGWGLEEKTRTRYEIGKAEGYISAMDAFYRGYETEEIFHEEDALRVMRRLEEEGWMQHLSPALSAAKANVSELERLRESQAHLQIQGVVANSAAANFPLLTAKMSAKELAELTESFPRQGFVEEIRGLEAKGKEFTVRLSAKGAALPSQAYQLITSADPEAVLWAAHTTKNAGLQAKFKSFYTEWPQARQRLPYLQLQEMRITPELPQYEELLDKVFFELMDGHLGTTEEMKAFLEPYSPPAPPPPVSLRRPRAPKKDAKPAKSRKKVAEPAEAEGETAVAVGEAEGTVAAAASPSITSPVKTVPAKGDAAGAVKGTAADLKGPKRETTSKRVAVTGKAVKLSREATPAAKQSAKNTPAAAKGAGKKAAAPKGFLAGVSAGKTAAKKTVPARKTTPAAKAGAAKTKAPVKKTVPVRTAQAKKLAVVKRTAPGRSAKPVVTKQVKKSAPAKKAAAAKGGAKKVTPKKKR